VVEGPSARAYAMRIDAKLKGEVVRLFWARSRRLFVSPKAVIGKRVDRAESFGKNIILKLEELAIRLHLMMYGTIHLYRLDEPLLKPERMVRLWLEGDRLRLVAYNAPIVELDSYERLMSRLRVELGPDPLRSEWNPEEAARRLKASGTKVGIALLDQRVIAGIGNILRNEILFRAGIHPERHVDDLNMEEVNRIVEEAKRLTDMFLKRKIKGERIGPILMIYNRFRQACINCGGPVKFYLQEPIKRKTFVCERCQH